MAEKKDKNKGILTNVPKPKKKAAGNGLSAEENKVFAQMRGDIAKEGKASPKQMTGLIRQVAEDQAKEDVLTGLAHPDAKALVAAGVPEDRVAQLTAVHAPSHPANTGTGFTTSPSGPAQYAGDVLIEAGLPDTPSNEALLERQMTEEGMPGGENNPLATTQKEAGSSAVNSAGVQQYPTLAEGARAEAQTLNEPGFSALKGALASGNATPNQYGGALEASNYEGLGGSSNPANVAYGEKYMGETPTTAFNGGGVTSSYTGGGSNLGSSALTQAASSNPFSGLGSVIPQLGSTGANQSLQGALQGLSSPGSEATLQANTANAPGSPDQTPSQAQQTATSSPASYQQALAALLPYIRPGAVK